ncbi:hypothetical protein V2A60_004807 [Cordyceps javanica]
MHFQRHLPSFVAQPPLNTTFSSFASSPAIHDGIDRRRFHNGARTAERIADNPFQDTTPPSYRATRSEASSLCVLSGDLGTGAKAQPSRETSPPRTTEPKNLGLILQPSTPPHSSAIAAQRPHYHRLAQEARIVSPVVTRKVGTLVAGRSVMSLRAHSEDFSLPDAAEEERALRPPPLHVVRRRPHATVAAAAGCGLRERDTTRRNLFRSSTDDGDDGWYGLLRHLGNGAPLSNEEQPTPWSPLYHGRTRHRRGSSSPPETPSTQRQSLALSYLSLTPTTMHLAGSSDEAEEEHSGFSPRHRQVGSTHQPLPDSPTLPAVGPQLILRCTPRRASHGSL